MPTLFRNTLCNTRLVSILFLGFSSGLPLALTSSTLQAWFTEEHVSLVTIGMLSLIGLPYAFKFLWAPLMDHYHLKWLGRRRSWIFIAQVGLVVTLAILAQLNPAGNTWLMAAFAFLISFFSASQDIAITAYQTDIVKDEERGLSAAYYIFAYRIALLVSGGLALLTASLYGWHNTYEAMACLIIFCMVATYLAPREQDVIEHKRSVLLNTVYAAFKDLLDRDKIVILLLFIMFYKFGDALALQLMTPFLMQGLGFSLQDLAWAYKVIGFTATILGGFVGGAMLTRLPIFRALLLFGLAQTFSNLMFVALSLYGKNYALLTTTMFIENFCSGLSTAALLAFMMSLCNHRYSASQFSLLSAIASSGRIFLGPLAGLMVTTLGWTQFYIWSFILCFPGIALLILLKDKVTYHAETVTD